MNLGSFKIKKSLKRTFWYVALVCVVLSSFGPATPANAAIPKYINFQGKLTKVSDGTNVSNGTYAFQFKLYDASAAGNLLWTETYDQANGACGKLTVTNAIFNAKLGSCNSLSGVDFTGGSLYLSVNFAPTGTSYDGEMSPRKQLVASPFAFIANGVSGDGKIDIANTGTNQATIGYDGTNKLQVNVGSTGFTTLTANGAGAGFNLTGGNVGIGTTNPGNKLHVVGNTYLDIATDGATGADLSVGSGSSGTGIYTTGSAYLTGGASIGGLQIDKSGSNIRFNAPIQIINGGPVISYQAGGTGIKVFQSNGTTAGWIGGGSLSIGSNYFTTNAPTNGALIEGNVGIGTTTAGSLLTVGTSGGFTVNGSGAVTAATGITSSGTITFSGLSGGGVVQATAGTGALTVGTLGVASGGTGATTLTGVLIGNGTSAITGTTTSSGISGALSDETGSGALVFGTSPTLATPTFTTSATGPLLIGGTGTTSTLTLRSTSGVGTTGADIIFQTGNNGATEAMRILNNGNVGIGTTNPSYGFEISGRHMLVGGTYGIFFQDSNAIIQQNQGEFRLVTQNSVPIAFHTAGAERIKIAISGNVGIGTSSPDAVLELAGNKSASAWGVNGIALQGTAATYTDSSTAVSGTATNAVFNSFGQPTLAASNTSVTTTNAATVYIAAQPVAGTNQTITNAYSLWVDAGNARFDGNVGIGTTNPAQARLQISDGTDSLVFNPGVTINSLPGANFGSVNDAGSAGKNLFITAKDIIIRNTTDATGVFIGETGGEAVAGAKLHVKGKGSTSSTANLLLQNSSSSNLFAVLDNGNVGIGTTAPSSLFQAVGGNNVDWTQVAQFNAGNAAGAGAGAYIAIQPSPASGRYDGARIYGGRWTDNRGLRIAAVPWSGVAAGSETLYVDIGTDAAGANGAFKFIGGNVGIGTTGASVPLAIGAASYGFGLRAGQALDAYINGVPSLDIQAGAVTLRSGQNLAWASSDDASQSVATRLSRLSDGKISVDTTTAGNSLGTLIAGNIGVGTTSPAHKLDVYGNGTTFRVFDTGNSDQFLVRTGSGGIGFSEAVLRGQGQTLSTYTNPQGSNQSGTYATYSALSSGIIASGNLALGSSNAEKVRIENTTGNVGIGTTTISAKLHSVATTEQLRLGYDASNYTSFTASSGGDLTIAPSGGNVILADTVTLNVGGIGAVAYNAFGDSAVAVHSSITGDDDLYVEDNAQVAGSLFIGNSVSAGSGVSTPLYVVTQHGGGIRIHPSSSTNTTWAFDISDATTRYAYLNFDQQAGNLLQLANNSSGSLNITTARASGGTTTSAFNIKTTTDLAAADELFQIGDSAADFLTVLGNGNVGIGTTSPAALLDVANTIQITGGSATLRASGGSLTLQGGTNSNINLTTSGGSLIVANGGYLRGVDGAVGTPTYSFNSDPNTGIYSGGTDILKISTGGADRVTVNASGNVGIGTISPAELLHVAGDIMQQNSRTRTMTRTLPTVVNDAVDIGSFSFTAGGSSLWVSIVVPSGGFSVSKEYLLPIKYAQTSSSWTIALPTSSTGSYGGNDFDLDINMTNGTASLRIRRTAGAVAGTAYIVIRQDGINTDSFTASTATASVAAPTTYFTSTALTQVGGNVGIGTTAPAAFLHVVSSSAGEGLRLGYDATHYASFNTSSNGALVISSVNAATGQGLIQLDSTGGSDGIMLTLNNVGTAYADISDTLNGYTYFHGTGSNVGIGTTAPLGNLDVYSSNSNTAAYFRAGATPNSSTSLVFQHYRLSSAREWVMGPATGNSNTSFALTNTTDAIEALSVQTNGNVGIGSTAPSQKLDVGGNIRASGDLLVAGDDLYMATNTSGYLLVADGTNYNPVAMSGDVTINSSGVTAIGADKITESMLKSVNAPTDEYCLTYEATVGDFEWQSCGGSTSWSGLTAPSGNLSLAMGSNTTAFTFNSVTTGTAFDISTTSLSSGTLFNLASTSTAAASNTQKVLNIATSGANGTSTQTTYGAYITNSHTGTSSTNIAAYFSATNGSNNYAAIFAAGNVGIGTTTAGQLLTVGSSGQLTVTSAGTLATSGNISTSSSGTITSASTLTASNGLTLTTGALNLTATSGSTSITGYGTQSITSTTTTGNINTYANSSLAPAASATAYLLNLTFTNAAANSTGTSTVAGINIAPTVSNNTASGTHETYGIRIQNAAGSPSAGTQNIYGIRIGNQGRTNAEASYGLYVDAQSGSTANYAAYFGGNVGIGTTAPGYLLQINAESDQIGFRNAAGSQLAGRLGRDSSGGMILNADLGSLILNAGSSADGITIQTNNTNKHIALLPTGNVGVGTSSPAALLHIKKTTDGQVLTAVENVSTGSNTFAEFQARNGTTDSDSIRMLVTGTSWSAINMFVQDAGVIATDGNLSGGLSIGTRTTADIRMYTNSAQVLTAKNGGVIQFNTYGAGTLTTDGSGNITASSDARLKTLQGEFTAGLAQILNIHPALYKWNDISGMETNGIYAGFVAQDIQNAIPEAVSTDSRGYLTLSDRPIIAASINAIKELNSTVVKQSSEQTITLTTLVTSGIALEVKTADTSLLSIDYVGTARFAGAVIVKKDVAVLGRVLGSTAIVAKNTSNQTIHQGDLVMLTGATDVPALGDNPTITVSPAVAGNGIIVGIADRNLADFNLDPDGMVPDDITEVKPGEFLSIVITGTYKKAMLDGSINIGDKLTASTTPGRVTRLDAGTAAQMIGISLDAAPTADGSIRIMILSGFQATPTITQVINQTSNTPPPSDNTVAPSEEQTPAAEEPPTEEPPVVEE